MNIAEALSLAAAEAGWNATRIAVECGVTEAAARRWMNGKAIPTGDKALILQRRLPGFAERVLPPQEGNCAAV